MGYCGKSEGWDGAAADGDDDDESRLGRMHFAANAAEAGVHNWNGEHMRLIGRNKRSFWYRSLEFFLLVHNYDPYAMFKANSPADHQSETTAARAIANRVAPALPAGPLDDPSSAEGIQLDATEKPISRRQRYMEQEQAQLQLPTTQADRRRHKCTRPIRVFVVYMLLKSLVVSFAQHSLLRHEYMVPRGRRPPLLSLGGAKLICDYLGNPLHVLKDTALLMYSAPAGLGVICYVLLPVYYKRHPLNIANLRFILNPAHELKRVDLNIRRKLNDIRLSLEVFEQRKREQLLLSSRTIIGEEFSSGRDGAGNHGRVSIALDDEASSLLQLKLYCTQLKRYLNQFERRLHTFRPELFSARYFRASSAKMSGAIMGTHVVYIICCCAMTSAVELPAYLVRCESRRVRAFEAPQIGAATASTFCNPIDIYSWPELILLTELPLVLILTYFTSSLNLALFSLVSANQTDLIKSIKSQLIECNALIGREILNKQVFHRRQDEPASSRERPASRSPHLLLEVPVTSSRPSSPTHRVNCRYKQLKARLRMDKSLLEALIKLLACENELSDNANNISELTIHAFYYAGAIIFFAIVNAQYKLSESHTIRYFIIIVAWFNFNAVAIACAHMFSRIIELERLMWLVLAANAVTFSGTETGETFQFIQEIGMVARGHEQNYGPDETRCCSLVADLWTKFVLATSLNVKRYCARPLNISLTYETIIELNFFAVLAYSLT